MRQLESAFHLISGRVLHIEPTSANGGKVGSDGLTTTWPSTSSSASFALAAVLSASLASLNVVPPVPASPATSFSFSLCCTAGTAVSTGTAASAVDGGVPPALPFSLSCSFRLAVAASRFFTVAGSSSRSCAERQPKAARNLLSPVRLRLGRVALALVAVGVEAAVRAVEGPAAGEAEAEAPIAPGGLLAAMLDVAGIVASVEGAAELTWGGRWIVSETKCVVSGVAGVNDIVGVTRVSLLLGPVALDSSPCTDVEGGAFDKVATATPCPGSAVLRGVD